MDREVARGRERNCFRPSAYAALYGTPLSLTTLAHQGHKSERKAPEAKTAPLKVQKLPCPTGKRKCAGCGKLTANLGLRCKGCL